MKGELHFYTTNVSSIYEMHTRYGPIWITNHFIVTIPVGQTVGSIDTRTPDSYVDLVLQVIIILMLAVLMFIRNAPKHTND